MGDRQRRLFEQLEALYDLSDTVARAEQASEIYEAALDALARAVGVERAAVLVRDPDGVMRFRASRGLSDAYRSAVEGHTPWKDDDPDPRPVLVDDVRTDAALAPFRDTILGEGIVALAFVPLLFGGALLGKFMLYHGAPHRFTAEEVRLVETIARHVAFAVAKKRSEERLHLYREIFEHSIDGIAVLDENGRYLEQNGAHRELIGYVDDELDGETPAMHLGDDAFRDLFDALREEGSARRRVVSTTKSGARIDVALSAFVVRGPQSGRMRVVGIKRNVTDEEAARREREALADELARALEARMEFISVASHELKTPVTALLLQLDGVMRSLSRGESSGDAVHARIANARKQVVRLVGLLDTMLDLSRIDAERFTVLLQPIDFAASFREAVERLRDDLEHAASPFVLRAEGPIEGRCDAHRFEQVVTNLLSNAAKYGRGGAIEASIEARGDRVRVTVRDEGMGIAKEDQGRIFDRFERAVGNARIAGFGLGLFITRQIVCALGGTIEVDSDRGRGATFMVDLPR